MTDFVGSGRRTVVDPFELRSVDDHLKVVMRTMPSPRCVHVPVAHSLGLVLAADVAAASPLPPFTNSAMDGYAVIASDLADAGASSPVTLVKTGQVHAGPVSGTDTVPAGGPGQGDNASVDPDREASASRPSVVAGTTVAVMTGAMLPAGSDAVVPVELTSAGPRGTVMFHAPVMAGASVRDAGEELQPGSMLLRAGHRVTAADVGVLLATGVDDVAVFARPRVSVITTGDELVSAGHRLARGQIRDSNGPMLAAMLTEMGCEVVLAGPISDRMAALTEALEVQVDHADLIVLSGGVSAGVADHVAEAIEALGEVERVKLAMQPGMPQALGRIGRVAVIGLPGNPVSTFVSFEVFVRPAVRVLQGRSDLLRAQVTAVLDEAVTSPAGKRSYLRIRVRRVDGVWHARLAGGQGSHMIGALSRADALGEVPDDVTAMAAGDRMRLHLLVP